MNIPVELRSGKDEFADLENSLSEVLMETGRELFREVLTALDEKLLEARDRNTYRNKGLWRTCVKMRLGEVEYSQHVYEERGTETYSVK